MVGFVFGKEQLGEALKKRNSFPSYSGFILQSDEAFVLLTYAKAGLFAPHSNTRYFETRPWAAGEAGGFGSTVVHDDLNENVFRPPLAYSTKTSK